jgi:hypothetical protein
MTLKSYWREGEREGRRKEGNIRLNLYDLGLGKGAFLLFLVGLGFELRA